jgi:hypothetical protein
MHKGSCLCGGVSYEIEGEFESFFLCHCKYCRKDTGSAHASNLFSAKATLRWLSGESSVKLYRLPATAHGRSFCSICGSALPGMQDSGKLLVVPAGSLDDELLSIEPNAHIYMASRAAWDQRLENIPMLDGLPGEIRENGESGS